MSEYQDNRTRNQDVYDSSYIPEKLTDEEKNIIKTQFKNDLSNVLKWLLKAGRFPPRSIKPDNIKWVAEQDINPYIQFAKNCTEHNADLKQDIENIFTKHCEQIGKLDSDNKSLYLYHISKKRLSINNPGFVEDYNIY